MKLIHVHFNSFFSQNMNMLFVMLPILTLFIYNNKSHNMKPLCNDIYFFLFSKLKNLFSNKMIYKHYAQLKVQVIEFNIIVCICNFYNDKTPRLISFQFIHKIININFKQTQTFNLLFSYVKIFHHFKKKLKNIY